MDQPGLPPTTDANVTGQGYAPRRFAIGDAMILVALAACSLGWISRSVTPARIGHYIRMAPSLYRYVYLGGPMPPRPLGFWKRDVMVDYLRSTPVTILAETCLPWLALLTLVFPLFRLRKPRPPWVDLARQPGTAAVLAVFLAILIEVDLRWVGGDVVPTPMPLNIGLAIVLAWTVLGVTRLWRGEASWVDRLGQVLGVCWIALGLVVAADGWAD